MITLFAILAMVSDYGHWYFPNSPLDWWAAVYFIIAVFSGLMQMVSIYELRRYTRSLTTVSELAGPLAWDLIFTTILTCVYASWI